MELFESSSDDCIATLFFPPDLFRELFSISGVKINSQTLIYGQTKCIYRFGFVVLTYFVPLFAISHTPFLKSQQ